MPAGAGRDAGAAGSGGEAEPPAGADNCPEGAPGERPADYLAAWSNGTRLEVRYVSAAGMPGAFAEVFDTELGVVCDFAWASDDQLRCLPRSTQLVRRVGYADADCSQEVWEASPACEGQTAYVRRSLPCRDQHEVRRLALYTGDLHEGSAVDCSVSADAGGPSSYTAGAVVPAQDFVAGTLQDLPGVCQGTLRVVESEDGAQVPYDVIDIATGAACDPVEMGCTPKYRAFEEPHLFSDATCETKVEERYGGWQYPAECGPPDFISPVGDKSVWYRPGPLMAEELYLPGCELALGSPFIQSLYELGTPVPLSELAPLETLLLGDERLQLRTSAELSIPLLGMASLFHDLHDTELDQACGLRSLADGSLRCIPRAATPSGVADEFEDAKCTAPIRRCPGDDCVGVLFLDEAVDPEACSSERPITAIWEVTAPATAYYRKSAGEPCAPGGDLSGDMWRVEAVEPGRFAAVTLETAP